MSKQILVLVAFLFISTVVSVGFLHLKSKSDNSEAAKNITFSQNFGFFQVGENKKDVVILDSRTSLYWMKKMPEEKSRRLEAKKYCEKSAYAGFTDWRLPTIWELHSIMKNCASSENLEQWKIHEITNQRGIFASKNFCPDKKSMEGWDELFGFAAGKDLWSSTSRSNPRVPVSWTAFLDKNYASSKADENSAHVLCVR